MNLFEIKNNKLTFAPQTLALTPFKKLWDRDKTKDKDVAINELAYVYFMCDYKSDYADIILEEERAEEVIKIINLPKKWVENEAVREAMVFYVSRRDGLVMQLYKTAKILLQKIMSFANEVNLNERDIKSGKPIHNIKQINDVVKQLGDSIESVENLEQMVKKSISQNKDRIGSRTKNQFEDGFK